MFGRAARGLSTRADVVKSIYGDHRPTAEQLVIMTEINTQRKNIQYLETEIDKPHTGPPQRFRETRMDELERQVKSSRTEIRAFIESLPMDAQHFVPTYSEWEREPGMITVWTLPGGPHDETR